MRRPSRPVLVTLLIIAVSCGLRIDARADVDVTIEGLDSKLKANVEATLSIAKMKDDAAENRVRKFHARAEEEIARAIQPFGYYAPRIRASLEQDGEDWKAIYTVEPGPQFHVNAVDIQIRGAGSSDSSFVALAKGFPLQPKDPLLHAQWSKGKSQLLDYAARHGYFDAVLDSSAIRVSLKAQQADLILWIESGPRYQFGTVTLHQDVLEDRMVEGYVTVKPGEPWDVDPLLQLQTGLGSSSWFSAVEVHHDLDNADSLRVPVDIHLIPAKSQKWELGAGYGTDTGPRGTVTTQWRRLNRKGHHADASVMGSAIEYSASTQYSIPWPYPDTRQLSFYMGVGQLDPEWSESLRFAVGSNFGLSRWGWREVWSLAWEYEDFTISDQQGISRLLVPGVSWTRTRADDELIPRRGRRFRLDLNGAHEALFSTASFIRVGAELKAIQTLHPRVRVIGVGMTARTFTDDFEALPPTHRLVTGGDKTIRGYSYESLGPKNANDDLIGGNSLVVLSGELEYRFAGSWGMAAFADTGNALDDFSGDFALGVGSGVRWFSPIGVVRVDLAVGLDDPGDPVRLHLSIGPDL